MSTTTTPIQWCDATWNPIRGCSLVSEGCRSCYAMKQAHRFSGPGKPYEGLTEIGPNGPRWTGKIALVDDALDQPLRWQRPRRIFVNSMSDLFHEDVPDSFIDKVFAVMALAPQHTFQILTKRAERMRAYFDAKTDEPRNGTLQQLDLRERIDDEAGNFSACHANLDAPGRWPLPNVWLGVSIENQRLADERIPLLLQTPAAVRFLSCEPLLAHLNVIQFLSDKYISQGGRQWIGAGGIHWGIVGCESGHDRRNQDAYEAQARALLNQFQSAGVAAFHKQMPIKGRVSGEVSEFPLDLQIREFPSWSRGSGSV